MKFCEERRALIAACLAMPQDSLRRLVYADWLEERRANSAAKAQRRFAERLRDWLYVYTGNVVVLYNRRRDTAEWWTCHLDGNVSCYDPNWCRYVREYAELCPWVGRPIVDITNEELMQELRLNG